MNIPVHLTALQDEAIAGLSQLTAKLNVLDAHDKPAQWMLDLIERRLDRLPFPGSGRTLFRWQALAAVAEHDLSLAKLYEGHTDALAILAELDRSTEEGYTAPPKAAVWGVWAAESAQARVTYEVADADAAPCEVKLFGIKNWCSGAADVSHALITAWSVNGAGPQLVRLAVRQPGVRIQADTWRAVGMANSGSAAVHFDNAAGHLIGQSADYVGRAGFSHGGAGVAACWYGGARGLGRALQRAVHQSPAALRSPFRLAALGKVDLYLHATACLLREAAQRIDSHPQTDAKVVAARVRLAAEHCARRVLDEASRALGPSAFCHDAAFARAAADLPVFIRQCHGERDFAELGGWAADEQKEAWSL